MAVAVLWIILFYLLPILEPLFAAQPEGAGNPLGALLLMRSVLLILSQGLAVIVIAAFVAAPILRRYGIWRRLLDRLPFVGALRRNARSQRVAGTLANIMLSGGDLDSALAAVVSTIGAGPAESELRAVRARVQDGAPLSEALVGARSLDPVLQQMAELGERGEHLPQLMQASAELLDSSLRKRLATLMAFLVPVLTISIGLIVGTLVMMTIGAVMSINDLAQ